MKIEEYERNGLTVEIYADDSPESPREWSNLGVMLCGHRRYNLGDEQIDNLSFMDECSDCEGTGEGYGPVTEPVGYYLESRAPDCPTCEGAGEIELSPVEWAKRERGARVVLPLRLFDHSGISMSVGAGAHPQDPGGWDSGQVGIIFDTAEGRAEMSFEDSTDEEIEEILRGEIEVYDQFISGDVYGYVIEDADGDQMDSLWGLYGHQYAIEEANGAADLAAKRVKREADERAHWAARDTITKGGSA